MAITPPPGSTLRPKGHARRCWVAAVALAATPALSACGAGFHAQTSEIYQAAAGTNSRSGGVYVLNALVVSDGEGNGTVVASLINQQGAADTLTDFTATDTAGKAISSPGVTTPIPLPAAPSAGQSVQVGTTGSLRLEGPDLVPGSDVDLTFTFAAAAPVVVTVPIVDVGTIYTEIPVGPVPTRPVATPLEPSDSAATTAG